MSKKGGNTVNEMLLGLIEKLKETRGMRIFKRGFERADELLQKGEEKGVFAWAPSLRYWLKERDYIFWLGAMVVMKGGHRFTKIVATETTEGTEGKYSVYSVAEIILCIQ